MKKILIFSLAYFPKHVGGAEVAIKEITDRIDSNEIEFHMVTNRFDSTLSRYEQIGHVHIHRIGITAKNPEMADLRKWPLHINKFLFQFVAVWEAHKLHARHRFDGIWAMMAHSTGIPAGLFKTFNTDVKYVLTLQEGDPPVTIERTMLPLWPLFVRAFRKADIVQSLSTFLASWARHMGFDGPLEIIPNAANTAHFSQTYSLAEMDAVKKDIGKKEGDVYLVTTSRLVEKNAVDDVIRALTFLPLNIKFVVFGTGPDEKALKQMVQTHNITDRVIFWGQINHKDMPKYLKACDIFIRPSRSEGFGVSFIEAFAAELPVITTQEGGIADFLFDEKRNPNRETTGWAVDKNAPKQIAQAVEDIVANPKKVTRVVAAAKALAIEKYDWDIIARDMKEKVFDRVL